MGALTALKLLKYGAPVLLVLGIFYGVYHLGTNHGEATIQAKWDKQKEADAKLVAAEKARIAVAETTHREQDRKISDELVAAKEKAAAGNSANELALAGRLRDSDKRAALYRSQAEAGAVERANLAGHAAELDRLLSESLGLLEEGRVLVELRDGQIRALASQINNDRQLISGQSTANEDAAVHAQ